MTDKAFLVGIEHYAETNWDVPGPALNAIAVARWLLSTGVAPSDIHLFANVYVGDAAPVGHGAEVDMALAALMTEGVDVHRDCSYSAIDSFWRSDLPEVAPGARLLTFWSGHGFTSNKHSRIFFCSDFTATLTNRVFHATQFLLSLTSMPYARYTRQIMVADVCANYVDYDVPDDLQRVTTQTVDQQVIFASREGEYAKGSEVRGAFTDIMLRVLQQIGDWPESGDLWRQTIAAAVGSDVTPFRIGGQDETEGYADRVVGRVAAASEDSRVQSLYSLLNAHDVTERMYLPHYLRTVEVLGAPDLLSAQGLLGGIERLASLRDGIVGERLPRGLIQFVIRLQSQADLAAPLDSWLDEHAAAQRNTLEEIRAGLAAARILIICARASRTGEIAEAEAHACSAAFELSEAGSSPAAPIASWDDFARYVEMCLDCFEDAGADLATSELHFAVDEALLDRCYHRLPRSCADSTPIGETAIVIVRLRSRVVQSDSSRYKDWWACADAIRAAPAAGLAWASWNAVGTPPAVTGPLFVEFALRTPDMPCASRLVRKQALAKLLKLGASFVYVPHDDPEDDWVARLGTVTDWLHRGPGAKDLSAEMRRERLRGTLAASDATLISDDPLDTPFSKMSGMGQR